MKKQNQDDFEERWDTIVPQAIENFELNVRDIDKEEPDHYDESPEPWLRLKNPTKKLEYIMNNDYWVRIWSNYLLKMLIDQIYEEPEFKFHHN